MTSEWYDARPSKIGSAFAKILEQQSVSSSCMLTSVHSVMIAVPFSTKSVTVSCSYSLRSLNFELEL